MWAMSVTETDSTQQIQYRAVHVKVQASQHKAAQTALSRHKKQLAS